MRDPDNVQALRDYHASLLELERAGLSTPSMRQMERLQAHIDAQDATIARLERTVAALRAPAPASSGPLRLLRGGKKGVPA